MASELLHADGKAYRHLGWAHDRDAMIAVDPESGAIVDANKAAEALTGRRAGDLLGHQAGDLYPEDEREYVSQMMHRAAIGHATTLATHVMRPDGLVPAVEMAVWATSAGTISSPLVARLREVNETEHRLAVQNWALSAYASALEVMNNAPTPRELMEAVCAAITREPEYRLAWVGLADDGPGSPVSIVASAGPALGYLDDLSLSWSADEVRGTCPTGTGIRTGVRQIMADSETDLTFGPWREKARANGLRSIVTLPFSIAGERRGGLTVCAARTNAFAPAAIEVFERLALHIGRSLHMLAQDEMLRIERLSRARSQDQLARALKATVGAMASTMEKRDPYTAGHQQRVAALALAIGRELGWDEDRLIGVEMAALVHDIGKIAVPAEILTKPARLSDAERAMMNEHPATGHAILKEIPFPWPVAEMVLQHHEKLDGSGYPRGLVGDAILPEAQVLAVADIVESMASFRPYRPALGIDTALAEIERQSGIQLNATIVTACVRLFREKAFKLP